MRRGVRPSAAVGIGFAASLGAIVGPIACGTAAVLLGLAFHLHVETDLFGESRDEPGLSLEDVVLVGVGVGWLVGVGLGMWACARNLRVRLSLLLVMTGVVLAVLIGFVALLPAPDAWFSLLFAFVAVPGVVAMTVAGLGWEIDSSAAPTSMQ